MGLYRWPSRWRRPRERAGRARRGTVSRMATIYRIKRTLPSGGVTHLDVTEAGRVYTSQTAAQTLAAERNALHDGSTYAAQVYVEPDPPPTGG
jgi:hypothetical protein